MKKSILVFVSVFTISLLSSCEPEKIDEEVVVNNNTNPAIDILSVDRTKIERPGNQGNSILLVDRTKIERPGNQND